MVKEKMSSVEISDPSIINYSLTKERDGSEKESPVGDNASIDLSIQEGLPTQNLNCDDLKSNSTEKCDTNIVKEQNADTHLISEDEKTSDNERNEKKQDGTTNENDTSEIDQLNNESTILVRNEPDDDLGKKEKSNDSPAEKQEEPQSVDVQKNKLNNKSAILVRNEPDDDLGTKEKSNDLPAENQEQPQNVDVHKKVTYSDYDASPNAKQWEGKANKDLKLFDIVNRVIDESQDLPDTSALLPKRYQKSNSISNSPNRNEKLPENTSGQELSSSKQKEWKDLDSDCDSDSNASLASDEDANEILEQDRKSLKTYKCTVAGCLQLISLYNWSSHMKMHEDEKQGSQTVIKSTSNVNTPKPFNVEKQMCQKKNTHVADSKNKKTKEENLDGKDSMSLEGKNEMVLNGVIHYRCTVKECSKFVRIYDWLDHTKTHDADRFEGKPNSKQSYVKLNIPKRPSFHTTTSQKSLPSTVMKGRVDEDLFSCMVCNIRIKGSYQLAHHVASTHLTQTNDKKYICPYGCDRCFELASHVEEHMREWHGPALSRRAGTENKQKYPQENGSSMEDSNSKDDTDGSFQSLFLKNAIDSFEKSQNNHEMSSKPYPVSMLQNVHTNSSSSSGGRKNRRKSTPRKINSGCFEETTESLSVQPKGEDEFNLPSYLVDIMKKSQEIAASRDNMIEPPMQRMKLSSEFDNEMKQSTSLNHSLGAERSLKVAPLVLFRNQNDSSSWNTLHPDQTDDSSNSKSDGKVDEDTIKLMEAVKKGPPYVCWQEGCGKELLNPRMLKRHQRCHHDMNLECPFENCGRMFKHKDYMDRHIRQVHDGIRPPQDTTLYKCEICGTYLRKISFQRHMKKQHGSRANFEYKCEVLNCGQIFDSYKKLMEHSPSHRRQIKKYICPYENCEKKFCDSKSLRFHINVHTGEKPYKCSYPNCTKAYKQKPHLYFHIKAVHKTAPIPTENLKCAHCHQQFQRQCTLTVHLKKHCKLLHNMPVKEAELSCRFCGQKFVRRNTLTVHMQKYCNLSKGVSTLSSVEENDSASNSQREPANFRCTECGRTFAWERNLIHHVKQNVCNRVRKRSVDGKLNHDGTRKSKSTSETSDSDVEESEEEEESPVTTLPLMIKEEPVSEGEDTNPAYNVHESNPTIEDEVCVKKEEIT